MTSQSQRKLTAHQAERSDEEEIAQSARGLIRSSGYRYFQHITCDLREGIMTLKGTVPSFYLKQVAQSLVGRLPGVQEVDNQIEVAAPSNIEAREKS